MIIEEYFDHDKLIDFYMSRGLEFGENKQYYCKSLFTYVAIENNNIIGAITIGIEKEYYVLDSIVVNSNYEGKGIGTKLYNIAIDRIKQEAPNAKIYLIAKKADFFLNKGFKIIQRKEAPEFSDCFNCPDFQKICNPEIMLLELK